MEKQKSNLVDIMKSTLQDAMKLKKVMIKKGLTRARAECPQTGCGGMLNGVLYKGRGGTCIRMYCDGACKRSMME